MKILLVGKDNIMKWPQSTYDALRSIHVPVELFLYNKRTIAFSVMHIFGKKCLRKWLAHRLEKKIESFQPDAIVFVSAFLIPKELFTVLKKYPHIKKAGWCGDKFDNSREPLANCLDILFCTDTGFKEQADHFTCRFEYLPLCANIICDYSKDKTLPPFFACGLNAERQKYLSAISTKCMLYIKNCPKDALPQHDVHYHTIPHDQMIEYISKSVCPINIGLSVNNVYGLNFRVFETGACGGLIMVNSECKDIEKCYEVGKEAVIYHSPEELNTLIADAVANPQKYEKIAKAGYDRTVRDHTYAKRMQQMIASLEEL